VVGEGKFEGGLMVDELESPISPQLAEEEGFFKVVEVSRDNRSG
jgi:hypothetical protein